MKVLVAANDPTRFSAPNIWLLRVLPLLKTKGIDAEVVFFHYNSPDGPVLDAARQAGLTCHLLPFKHTEVCVRDLLKLAGNVQPDVFVPNVNVASYFAARFLREAGIRTVAVLRSDDPFYHDIKNVFIGGLPEWRVDAAVGVSEFLCSEISEAGGRDIPAMACPSGAPVPASVVSPPEDAFVLTWCGRFVQEQKRIDVVVPAVIRLLQKYTRLEANFFGDGPLRKDMMKLVKDAGLEGRFRMPGMIAPDKIQESLREGHAFLLLSDYEGLSTGLLEAMACGLPPIVLEMQSGLNEVVEDYETGLVISDRTDALEKAVDHLLNDTALWKKLSGNARSLVKAKYSSAVCAENWAAFLHKLCPEPVSEDRIIPQPEDLKLPPKTEHPRGIALEDHRLPDTTRRPLGGCNIPVLLVRSHAHNYSETFIEDHIRYLSSRLDVLFGYPFPRYKADGKTVLDAHTNVVIDSMNRKGLVIGGKTWEAYVQAMARFLKKQSYRVVLAESGLMGAYLYESCQLAGIPLVVHFHGVDAFMTGLLENWKNHYAGIFRSATSIIAVSKAMQEQLISLGAPASRTILAPYGVNVNLPGIAEPEEAPLQFVAVGRFTEKKAPHLTLQAFRIVHKELPEAQLVMVGDGPLLKSCQEWVEASGLSRNVTFAGVQSREAVSRLMRESRVFVQHSVRASNGDCEGLPLAVLEAGAHALPVISTVHAGIPDAVIDGRHGLLVEEGDVHGMAKAMIELGRKPGKASVLGAAFRQRVLDKYSRERSITRLQGILQDAAGTASRKPGAKAIVGNVKSPARQLFDKSVLALKEGRSADAVAYLEAALSHDRGLSEGYLKLGEHLVKAACYEEAFLMFKEAGRKGKLPPAVCGLLESMEQNRELDTPIVRAYNSRIRRTAARPTERPLRILVFTNLLPPQEMGGYGRTVWEFCDRLLQKGHTVKVLTADMQDLHKEPEPGWERVEQHVERSLKLFGNWKNGAAVHETDPKKIRRIMGHNLENIIKTARAFSPDVCMAGNMDYVGSAPLEALCDLGIPIVHRLGNAHPGYPVEATPRSPLYCVAGCSQWVNDQLIKNAYPVEKFSVLPPGSPLEDYYCLVPPDTGKLRIAYAGLVMAYKGPHILIRALGLLKKIGVSFTCEIAGDTKDPSYLSALRRLIQTEGVGDSVRLLGFCSRRELAALYGRSNVLVFPSVFEEPFGKSQIEAQAAGLAVVSSGSGGSREIIRDGENGILFRNQDPEDLARQLYVLQKDTAFWKQIARQGQDEAFRFSTDASVETLETLLQDMVSSVLPTGN